MFYDKLYNGAFFNLPNAEFSYEPQTLNEAVMLCKAYYDAAIVRYALGEEDADKYAAIANTLQTYCWKLKG